MTEKRFILKYLPYETDNGEIIEADPYYIDKEEEYVDEEDYFTIDGYPTMSDKQVVDLLNELSEENEQLKQFQQEVSRVIESKMGDNVCNDYKMEVLKEIWNELNLDEVWFE